MARYRKKPIVIEAFQLNSRGLVGEDWFWDAVTRNDIITHSFGKHEPEDAWCEIKTLEGVMIAHTGDYIIRGVKGEIYPCRADIFEATYDEPTVDIRSTAIEEFAERLKKYYNNLNGTTSSGLVAYHIEQIRKEMLEKTT